MAELRKLLDLCEFGPHQLEALKDRLVCGMRSENIQKRLLIEENLTLEKPSVLLMEWKQQIRKLRNCNSKYHPWQVQTGQVEFSTCKDRETMKGLLLPSHSLLLGKALHVGIVERPVIWLTQVFTSTKLVDHVERMATLPKCVGNQQPHHKKAHVVNERDSSPDDGEHEELPLLNISVVKPISNQAGFMVEVKIDQKPLIMGWIQGHLCH